MLKGFLPSDLRIAPLEILNIDNNQLEGMIPPMLCHKDDINGNGINGSFNCDLIACSPGTWSPVGRATPTFLEQGPGFEAHECHLCYEHTMGFLGAVECGNTHPLDHETLRGVTGVAGEVDIVLTLTILCSFVGILTAYIICRNRKMRQQLQRNANSRDNSGFDTDSYCTEATDAHSVLITKLGLGDDTSVQSEESGTGIASEFGTGLESLEMVAIIERNEDLVVEPESVLSTRYKPIETLSESSNRLSGGKFSKHDQSDLWIDVPSI